MTSTRCSFSLREKRDAVHSIEFMIQNGYSESMSCCIIGIPILYYQRWSKIMKEVCDLEEEDGFIHYNTNGSAGKVHSRSNCPSLSQNSKIRDYKGQIKCFQVRPHTLHWPFTTRRPWQRYKSSVAFQSSWSNSMGCHSHYPKAFQGNRIWVERFHCNDWGKTAGQE